MATCRATLKLTNDPLIGSKTNSDNMKQTINDNLWYMPCEGAMNMTNNLRANFLVVTKDNGLSKL
jgi:hypothetical protein